MSPSTDTDTSTDTSTGTGTGTGTVVVVVNGSPREVPAGSTVADVVAQLVPGAPDGARGTAVALGDEVVPAGRWASTLVAAGDRLEVLRAVAGG